MSKFYSMALPILSVVLAAFPAWSADTARIQLAGVKTLSVTPGITRYSTAHRAAHQQDNIAVGDTLPLEYMMVVDIQRYHFPRPRDGWVYFEVGQNIMRVDLNTRIVLEQMDTLAN